MQIHIYKYNIVQIGAEQGSQLWHHHSWFFWTPSICQGQQHVQTLLEVFNVVCHLPGETLFRTFPRIISDSKVDGPTFLKWSGDFLNWGGTPRSSKSLGHLGMVTWGSPLIFTTPLCRYAIHVPRSTSQQIIVSSESTALDLALQLGSNGLFWGKPYWDPWLLHPLTAGNLIELWNMALW